MNKKKITTLEETHTVDRVLPLPRELKRMWIKWAIENVYNTCKAYEKQPLYERKLTVLSSNFFAACAYFIIGE